MKFNFFISIIIISIFFWNCSAPSTDQDQTSEALVKQPETERKIHPDTLLMNQLYRQVLLEYLKEGGAVDTMLNQLSTAELESRMEQEYGSSLLIDQEAIQIFYPADSQFSLFVVEGETCGAYCNPLWEGFIRFSTNNDQKNFQNAAQPCHSHPKAP